MIEYAFDRTNVEPTPPTKEAIERLRVEQLEALKVLRRKVLDVQESGRPAA